MERDDERERELQQLERGAERERGEREGGEEREAEENVFNYSALPVFSIYGPFREASRNYIYTRTVGTGSSLKYSSPGKFQPQKQGKGERRRKT